jgi:autotransporter-associated beta strand protein
MQTQFALLAAGVPNVARIRTSSRVRKPLRKIKVALEQLESRLAPSVNVLSYDYGNTGSSGVNAGETQLTPANVNSTNFGKLFKVTTDGPVRGQPLIEQNVVIGASSGDSGVNIVGPTGTHNVVFVGTEHASIYAIDTGSGTILWQRSFLSVSPSNTGSTPGTNINNILGATAISPKSPGGVLATSVIDPISGTLYAMIGTVETIGGVTHYVHVMHGISTSDGTDKVQPFLVGDTFGSTNNTPMFVYGTGDGAVTDPNAATDGNPGTMMVQFNGQVDHDRAALSLVNGKLYAEFCSPGDIFPYHGWIISWNVSPSGFTLAGWFCTCPNDGLSGIWMGGGTLQFEPDGSAWYFETGNGSGGNPTLNAQGLPTNANYNEALVKMVADPTTSVNHQGPNGWGMKVVDYFIPYNVNALDVADADFGSGSPLLLPPSAGIPGHPNLILSAGKSGEIYLSDRNSLGKFDPVNDNVLNAVNDGSGHIEPPNLISGSLSTGAYFNGKIYWVSGYTGAAYAYQISSSGIVSAVSQSTNQMGFEPGSLQVSSNGAVNGIVWVMDRSLNAIHAFDASTFSTELWNSNQKAGDALDSTLTFQAPTVANGEVFVGTSDSLMAFGLNQAPTAPPSAPVLTATPLTGSSINLTWTDPSTYPNTAASYSVEESTDGTTYSFVTTAPAGASSIAIGGLTPSTSYSFRIRGQDALGFSPYSNSVTATTTTQVPGLDFSAGFGAAAAQNQFTINGSAHFSGSNLELTTSGNANQGGSAFITSPVDVTSFQTQFTFQTTNSSTSAEGFTFTLQNANPTALGGTGAALGYGPQLGGGSPGINNSVAIKFDLNSNNGEGPDSTGLYVNGAAPTSAGSIDLGATGINLHNGDVFRVNMNYNGAQLTVTITDTATNASVMESYSIGIVSTLGSTTGYVGFTGSTGTQTATQDILTWTYTPTAAFSPNAPSGLGAVPATANSVLLNWTTNSNNQTSFNLDRATDSMFTQNVITENLPATPSSFTDTAAGLAPGGTYYYRIRAFNSAGNSGNSNVANVTIPLPPPAATNLQVLSVSSSEIDLQWTDNAGHNTQGYHVYRATNHGSFALIANLPPTSRIAPDPYGFSDTSVSPGTFYEYQIVCYNTSGNNGLADISTTSLTTPPNLVYIQLSGTTATLYFSVSAGAVNYNVYRGAASGAETLLASHVSGSPYTDSTLTSGTTYYYYVTSVNANVAPMPNESVPSDEISPRTSSGTFQWSGGGSDANWTTPANWMGGAVPTGDGNETLVFPGGAAQLASVDNLSAGANAFAGITFSGAGYTLTLTNPMAVASGGIQEQAAGTNTLTGSATVGLFLVANQTFSMVSGAILNVNAPIDNGGFILTIAGAGNTNLNGILSDSGGLTVSGTTTLTLSAANTYTGATVISSGTTVNAQNAGALGINSAVTNNGTVNALPTAGLMGTYYNTAGATDPQDSVGIPANSSPASLLAYAATLPVLATDNSANFPQPGTSNWNQNGLYFDYGEDGVAANAGFPTSVISATSGNSFLAIWSGQFYAPVTGVYDFGTSSDDGSAIYVDGALVVDNNNYQGMTFRDSNNPLDAGVTSAPTLTAGVHSIIIAYYEGGGGYGLYATVAGPAGSGYVGRLLNAALSPAFFGTMQIGSLIGTGTFNLGPTALTIGGNNTSSVFAGNLKGFGNYTKVGAGALTLSAVEAFTGTWTINNGQLGLGTSGSPISGENMGAIVNNTSNNVIINNPSGNTFTLNAAISGTAGLTLTGTGTYLLGGASTFTGPVSIPAGAVVTTSGSSPLGNGDVALPTGSTLNVSANSFGGGLPVTWYNWAGATDPVTAAGGNPPSATTTALLNYVAGLPVINTGIPGETSATPNAANSGGTILEYGNHGSLGNGFDTVLTMLPAPNNGPNSFLGIFQGLFFAPVAGVYDFGTGSDDSSNLYIDGKLVVDNNHVQPYTVRYSDSPYDTGATTPPTLTAGIHTILVEYSEAGGGYAFDAFVKGPAGSGISGVLSNSLLGVSVGKLAVGSLTGGGTVNLGGNSIVIGGNNHNTLFPGTINGTATATGGPNLIKTGTGTLTLPNPAKLNITGSVAILGGTLQIGDGTTSLGSALGLPAILDNGTLILNGPSSSNLTFNGAISGSGGLTQIGAWTLTLGGNSSYTGPTVIPAGATLNASSSTALGNGDLNLPAGATLNVLAAGTPNLGSGLPGKYYSISGDALPDARMNSVAGINAMIAQYVGTGPIATDTSAFTTANGQGQTNTNSNGATFNFGTGSTGATTTAGFPTVVKTTNSGGNSIFGVWTGVFFAPSPGTYGFDTASDDGSTLFIDGTLVVGNNFQQGVTTRQGTINLAAGPHSIEIAFENGGGGYGLWVDVQLPGATSFQRLPNSLLGTAAPNLLQIGALSGSGTVNLATSPSVANNGLTVGTDNHSTTFTGTINSPGTTAANFPNLVKGGTGTFVLTHGETYTGSTGIAGGVLQLGTAASPISTLPTSSVFDNGTLTLFLPNNSTFTYNGVISGQGGVTIQGTGVTVNLGGVNTYSGPTLVGANKIVQMVNNALPPASAITLGAGSQSGQIELNGHYAAIGSITAVGTGTSTVLGNSSGVPVTLTLTDNGAPVNVNVAITGNLSLVVAGPGTQTFTAVDTYNGSTSISAGTFIAAGSAALPSGGALSVSGTGVLDLDGHSVSVLSLGGIGSTNLITNSSATPATLTITGATGGPFAYNGLITAAVSLVDAGGASVVTNLDGSLSTFSGGVTATSGILGAVRGAFGTGTVTLYGGTVDLLTGQTVYPNNFQASAGSTSGLIVSATPTASAYGIGGSFNVATGATVNVGADPTSTANQGYTLTLSGSTVLSGNVNLASNGSGAASLVFAGPVGGSGTSIGAIGGSGNVTFAAGSAYNLVLGGSGSGQYDSLSISGAVSLAGGNLNVAYANNFSPAPGQSFTILQATGALTGTFAQGGTITSGNATYAIAYNAHSVVLTVTAVQPASSLVLMVPATATVGLPVTATVIAQDSGGNVAGGFAGTVTLGSSAGADLTPTGIALVNGTATVAITLTAAGSQTLTAAYGGLTSGTASINVSPGPLAKFLVTPVVGGGSATAGSLFPIVVQAADSYGNPITSGYSGPALVTLGITPTSATSAFPQTVSMGSQGMGLGVGRMNVAGSYTITAAGGSFTGSAAPLTITPAPAVKLAFASQPASTATGNTLPPVTVQVQDAYGNVITTDNTDAVSLGIATGPGSGAPGFTPGSTTTAIVHNGVATFTNLTLAVPGAYTLSEIVPAVLIGPNSSSFTVSPLQVLPGSFQSSPSGFSVGFTAPFLVDSVTPALYGSGFGPGATVSPTVTLTQTSGTPPSGFTLPFQVPGSLIVNTATNSLTFVETDTAGVVNSGTPLLPDGNYTVRISSSGLNGLQALDAGGGYLDGTNAGTPGHDYTTSFTISASGSDALWIPATADGPGQALSAPGANRAGGGYPVYLSDSSGAVTSVQLTLNYNPALLSVTGVSGTGFTLLGGSTPGQALLQYSGPALSAGNQTPVGYLQATVPSGTAVNPTPYRAKDLLHLSGVALNGGALSVVTVDALHLVAYVGDGNGDGSYSSDDAVKITRTALQTDTGFTAYALVDPVIVGDTDGSGFLPADAALQVNEAGVGFPTSNLPNPPIPPNVHFQAIGNNVDPSLSLELRAQRSEQSNGGIVTAAVNLDDADPAGSTGLIRGHLALTYDPRLFSVGAADVHAGSLLAGGNWEVVPTIDPTTGQIGIALSSSTPIQSALGGSLVTIDLHPIARGIGNPSDNIALVASATPEGQYFATELEDAQGTFVLTSAPANVAPPVANSVMPRTIAGHVETADVARPSFRPAESPGPDFAMADGPSAGGVNEPDTGAGNVGGTFLSVETPGRTGMSVSPASTSAPIPTGAAALLTQIMNVAPGAGLVFQLSGAVMLNGPGSGGNALAQRLADQFFETFVRGAFHDATVTGPILALPLADFFDVRLEELDTGGQTPTSREDARLPSSCTWSNADAPVQRQLDQTAVDEYFAQAVNDADLPSLDD